MATWLQLCQQACPQAADLLAAFPGQPRREAADLDGLEAGLPEQPAIAGGLHPEVDLAQATMFQRRFQALDSLLRSMEGCQARVYRLALRCRLDEMLAAPGPRAQRVRALIDYYYSHTALLRHQDPGAPQPWELPVPWRQVAPGLEHATVTGISRRGPVHANLLRARGLRLRTLDARGRALGDWVAHHGALAGVSGGFFLYSEPDIDAPSRRGDPVGLLVDQGELLNLPVFPRSALLQGADTRIQRQGLSGLTLQLDDVSVTVAGSNDPGALGRAPVAFNRAWGETCPDHWGPSLAIVGTRVVARGHGAMRIPLAGFVLALPRRHPMPQAEHLRCALPWHNAIAGGPRLLHQGRLQLSLVDEDFALDAPPVTFSRDETFDQNLLPRMAVGTDADGALIFAAVDGRDFHRAPGMTLRDTARLLQAQGCVEAMNLDGGSSKRMYVGDRLVDLSSTEIRGAGSEPQAPRQRPVHSAILLLP